MEQEAVACAAPALMHLGQAPEALAGATAHHHIQQRNLGTRGQKEVIFITSPNTIAWWCYSNRSVYYAAANRAAPTGSSAPGQEPPLQTMKETAAAPEGRSADSQRQRSSAPHTEAHCAELSLELLLLLLLVLKLC